MINKKLNIYQLEGWIKNIQVRNLMEADVEVINNSPMVMIGKGRQGAVFQVSDDICVKVFGNSEDCEREYYALSLGQQTNLLPRVYAKGQRYIAMEMVKGVDLREYLQSQTLTQELSAKLIQMLVTFKEIGFERIDHHKRQIFLQPDGNLKVIDVARTVWRDRVYPYPRKLLTSLGEKNKALFLSHVQALAPEVYNEWMHYIRMEEQSRQILQVLLSQQTDNNALKDVSQKLLTTNDEEKYSVMLESLVSKVFKEEWTKMMLARGYDLHTLNEMEKYWDNQNQNSRYSRDHYSSERRRESKYVKEQHSDKVEYQHQRKQDVKPSTSPWLNNKYITNKGRNLRGGAQI